jgi:hypothetical protein
VIEFYGEIKMGERKNPQGREATNYARGGSRYDVFLGRENLNSDPAS